MEGDGQERLAVRPQQEDAAVVVVDQASKLRRDGFADLTEVIQSVESGGQAVHHLEVSDGPQLATSGQTGQASPRALAVPAAGSGGAFLGGHRGLLLTGPGDQRPAPVYQDAVLAGLLRVEQREVGAGDQFARTRRVEGGAGNPDAHGDPADQGEAHAAHALPQPFGQGHSFL